MVILLNPPLVSESARIFDLRFSTASETSIEFLMSTLEVISILLKMTIIYIDGFANILYILILPQTQIKHFLYSILYTDSYYSKCIKITNNYYSLKLFLNFLILTIFIIIMLQITAINLYCKWCSLWFLFQRKVNVIQRKTKFNSP